MGTSSSKNHLLDHLETILRRYEAVAVCFSGGVDSTLLLAAAKRCLGDSVVAVTADSPVHPARELAGARETARRLKADHLVFASREMQDPRFLENPRDRCYHCKALLFADILALAARRGITTVAHGANLDDLQDDRPGFRAAGELRIAAPLIEAQLTKEDIRVLSRHLGLPTWDRPAMPCLATRIPYGTAISMDLLRQIETAEMFLQDLGFEGCRVRMSGTAARLELRLPDIAKAAVPATARMIVAEFKRLGLTSISVDLEGYRQGSMNRIGS